MSTLATADGRPVKTETVITHGPEETEALGRSWAAGLTNGQIIGLSGDLGAGKTHLVKGIARGLGFTGKVQSPTFALINEYPGRLKLFHLDLYRLETRDEIIAAGLEEYLFRPQGVAVIEWIERWSADTPLQEYPWPKQFRLARIEQLSELERRIVYEDFGD